MATRSRFSDGDPGVADVPDGVGVIVGDRNRLEASAREFGELRPNVVVDAIAFTEEQAKGLGRAFNGIAKRIVVLSSGDVYRANDLLFRRITGPLDPTPLRESSPLRDRLYPYRGTPVPPVEGFSWDDYDKVVVERAVMSNDQTVLILSDMEGLKDREIAEILDVTVEAAKVRLHRARARLRKILDSECTFYYDPRNTLLCDLKG
jgi:hypothetical protein